MKKLCYKIGNDCGSVSTITIMELQTNISKLLPKATTSLRLMILLDNGRSISLEYQVTVQFQEIIVEYSGILKQGN